MPTYENGGLVRLRCISSEALTVSTAAIAPASVPTTGSVRRVLIQPIDQPIRVRADGDPTNARGLKVLAGDLLVWECDPTGLKLIRDAAATGDATVEIHYFGV